MLTIVIVPQLQDMSAFASLSALTLLNVLITRSLPLNYEANLRPLFWGSKNRYLYA